MEKRYKNILIREAKVDDAEQLCSWWNDGKVMEHAGFPNGLNTSVDKIKQQLVENNTGNIHKNQRHVILYENVSIGEMNYIEIDKNTCEIGIKICNFSMQNKGLGKVILSLFIDTLFNEYGYQKIILDTNLKNKRAQHVYEQLGFKRIRINENSWKDQLGNMQSSVDYELTKESFITYLLKETMYVNHNEYKVIQLLGHGKGGYSYLVEKDNIYYVLKQIHHEPCDYYTFGNKIESERNDYLKLLNTGIRIPKMIDIDIENERILKEYIHGDTIDKYVNNNQMKDIYYDQINEMSNIVTNAGLNIDYYPTNFVVQNDLIYYIDYECNKYSDEWNFNNWGIKYWKKNCV